MGSQFGLDVCPVHVQLSHGVSDQSTKVERRRGTMIQKVRDNGIVVGNIAEKL